MLIVLVGARGAGKTTLQDNLRGEGVEVLQPSTTRLPRFQGETEYDFVQNWKPHNYAWSITVGEHFYGMRRSELKRAEKRTCAVSYTHLTLPTTPYV